MNRCHDHDANRDADPAGGTAQRRPSQSSSRCPQRCSQSSKWRHGFQPRRQSPRRSESSGSRPARSPLERAAKVPVTGPNASRQTSDTERLQSSTESNLANTGRCGAGWPAAYGSTAPRIRSPMGTRRPSGKRQCTGGDIRRGVAGHRPRRTVLGERGNHADAVLASRDAGQVHGRLVASTWGGVPVVVRARESRPHGEGERRTAVDVRNEEMTLNSDKPASVGYSTSNGRCTD